MKTISQRLNNITGQIEGIKRMVESESECMEVLTQLKAVRSAISSTMNAIVETELDKCMCDASEKEKTLLIKLKDYVKTN